MSGLLAAKACMDMHVDFDMYDKGKPSPGNGVRYLHDSCGLPIKPIFIETAFVGPKNKFFTFGEVDLNAMAEFYHLKTGASEKNNSVHRSKRLVKAYDWYDAWNMLQGIQVRPYEADDERMYALSRRYDVVFLTAPLNKVYRNAAKQCLYHTKYVSGGDGRIGLCNAQFSNNVIVYNVDLDCDWTRYSRINGVEQIEWKREVPGSYPVVKVSGKTTFIPPESNVVLLGRYGAWDSGFMAHDAYYKALDVIRGSNETR